LTDFGEFELLEPFGDPVAGAGVYRLYVARARLRATGRERWRLEVREGWTGRPSPYDGEDRGWGRVYDWADGDRDEAVARGMGRMALLLGDPERSEAGS
jgi:hypothetical protein